MTTATSVAVTGANGFVGRRLVAELAARGYAVRALVRHATVPLVGASDIRSIGDLTASDGLLAGAVEGVDVVVHAAGIAHTKGVPEERMHEVNVGGTTLVVGACKKVGVRRLVFISSVRAQSGPSARQVLTEATPPVPVDAYGRSKLAAERSLAEVDLDWVALRPVLVYGPAVTGNLRALLKLARSPLPLPFGAVSGLRSLLAVDALAAAVATVIETPAPLRRAFLVADARPLTLPQMLVALRQGLGRPPRLVGVPEPLLRGLLHSFGRSAVAERLLGSLVVDTAALEALGWQPATSTEAGLAALAAGGTSE
ncbi:MAG: NAD-dependent epimerase/dehydratase family protein [Pseudomonadota bacterium]